MSAAREEHPIVTIEREVGLTGNLHQFVQIAWEHVEPNAPFVDGWHIGAQCEHYQAIEEGQIKWLLVNIPPGCSKSRISGVFWPIWAWLRKPHLRWGHYSFDATNTLQQSRDSLALMNSLWFQERWGEKIKFPDREPAEGSYFNTEGGWRFANSVEGKATGKHFHRQVIDDPIKPRDVTDVALANTKKWLSGTMATRWARGAEHTARAIVMQRLHEDDTSAQAIADGRYVHLMLPMHFDPKRKCSIGVTGFEDPRTEEGELLCPDFMTPEVIKDLTKDLTEQEATAQLEQNPTGQTGVIFKDEYFRYWLHEGSDAGARFDQQVPPRGWILLPKKMDLIWQSWDFTFKDTKTADFVVGQVWGRKGPDFFLLYQVRDRMDFPASLTAIKATTKLWPKARTKLVEDKANGSAIISSLKSRMFGVEEVEPEGGKEARASAVAPLHKSGNVYYPDPDMPGFEWVKGHVAEMKAFPFGKYDDQVDCESQALNWGSTGFKEFQAAMDRLKGNNPHAARLRQLLTRFGR